MKMKMLTRYIITDDINLVKHMPICAQIVSGRFGEEKAVAVAKVIDQVMVRGESSRPLERL